MNKLAFTVLLAAALTACSDKPEPIPEKPKMSDQEKRSMYQQIEAALERSRSNAVLTATLYRIENPRLDGTSIVAHADSTITAECPSGDGWASVSFIGAKPEDRKEKPEKYTVVCSTVSEARGCWMRADFEKKPYALQEGRCDNSLPVPLPVLSKR